MRSALLLLAVVQVATSEASVSEAHGQKNEVMDLGIMQLQMQCYKVGKDQDFGHQLQEE